MKSIRRGRERVRDRERPGSSENQAKLWVDLTKFQMLSIKWNVMHVRKGLLNNEVLFHKLNWALIPKPLRWSIKGWWRVIIAVNFQFPNFKKYQGFNGIRKRDLCDTGAMLDPLSCEATHWERGQFAECIPSRAVKWWISHLYFTSFHCKGRYELNKLTSLPMCGFTAQLVEDRTGIA